MRKDMKEVVFTFTVSDLGIELIRAIQQSLTNGMTKFDVQTLRQDVESFKRYIDEAEDWYVTTEMREVSELIEGVLDVNVMAEEAAEAEMEPRRFGSHLDISADRLIIKGVEPNSVDGAKLASEIEKFEAFFLRIRENAWDINETTSLSTGGSAWNGFERDESDFILPLSNWFGQEKGLINQILAQWLLERKLERRSVVIIGPRWTGENGLSKRLYRVLENKFELCCWVSVSLAYNVRRIVLLTMKQIYAAERAYKRAGIDVMSDGEADAVSGDEYEATSDDDFDSMSDEKLVRTLRRSLQSKKYLVVFDDALSKEFWDLMRDVLPDDNTGSRIIITTSNDTDMPTYYEGFMSEAMYRGLFYGIAFSDEPEQRFHAEFEQLSLEVVRMCKGLSFAIVAIASLLSTKEKVPQLWRKVLEDFSLEDLVFRGLFRRLDAKFHDLPRPLKQCFLHFSIFPKGSLIPNDQLVKLWIAEGFVQEKVGKKLEEVAEEYLKELTNRNLVQVCQGFHGIEEFSRVNRLMHEVGRKMASECSFCQIWDGKESSFRGNSRRLFISDGSIEQVFETTQEESRVRTLVMSNIVAPGDSALLALFQQCKILTLLVIENTPIDFIPEEVGNLLCLKYLSLKNTKIMNIPKSVSNLHKLQTLELSGTLLTELPKKIFKLQSLRHLLASRCDNEIGISSAKGVKIKGGIRYLVNLQTLMTVEAHLSGMVVIQELKRLTKLRSLSVSRLTPKLARALCACIKVMRQLESLRLHSMNNQILDLQAIKSPPPHLKRLVLKGFLNKFPHWISGLQNLSMLCLNLSGLVIDPLRHLCILPNLESLWLYRAYEGESLQFPGGGFKKLKLLVLRDLQRLETVEIEEGSLLLLEELRIGPSALMNEVPSGIECLRNLKLVSFYDMPKEFVLRMKPHGRSDYWKLEHVPSVLFHYKDEGRRYKTYKLGETDLLNHLEGLDANINDVNQRDIRLSFCYSDEEEDSALPTTSQWNGISNRFSFSSDRFSFFTDDVEE